MALDFAIIPGDSYVIRNLITSKPELLGIASLKNPEAALRYLSRVWIATALGDQGELSTLKALLDSKIPIENILIKSNLINHLGERACPDFYCEAKAWKSIHSLRNLQKVANKYANCFEDSGEVGLYFPTDLYETHRQTLKKLSSPNPSVKVTIYPLPETHKELELRKQLFYNYIKLYKRKE